MAQYEVVSEQGVVLEGTDDTIHPMGAILELEPEAEQVKALLENDTIKLVSEQPIETEAADKVAAEAEAEEAAAAEKPHAESSAVAPSSGPSAPARHPLA